METTEETRKLAIQKIKTSDQFIVITYNQSSGVVINSSINNYGFTMLGAIELAKIKLMESFVNEAKKELGKDSE